MIVQMIIYRIPVRVVMKLLRHEYQHIENCLFGKFLLDKLVLKCADEILNKFKALPDNKKVTWEKIISLIHII